MTARVAPGDCPGGHFRLRPPGTTRGAPLAVLAPAHGSRLAATQAEGASMSVRVRRVYEPPEPDDGVRVLVDRLWPRGLAKDAAHVDEWPKGLTPSAELRRWYHAGEGDFEEFRERYEAELVEPGGGGAAGAGAGAGREGHGDPADRLQAAGTQSR